MRLAYLAPLALLLAAGCASDPKFEQPMTAVDFARHDTGAALVAYLAQRDASPEVCNAKANAPHLARFDDEMRDALVDGLVDGKIEPSLWRKCVKSFLRSAPADPAASLMDAIGKGYKKLLMDKELDRSSLQQKRLDAMQKLYLDRDNGLGGHAKVLGPMFDDLRQAIAKKRLGPLATKYGTELLVAVDLERGLFEGRPVDVAAIDRLYAAKNERALKVFAERVPNPALRDESKRRIIRLHIAASPFAEVRAASAEVEATLMKVGINAVSLAEHAPSRVTIDASKVPQRGVLVRQDIHAQTVKLLGVRLDVPGASVVPDVSLRGALQIDVGGISRPITVCARAKELDPSPCVAIADVKTGQKTTFVDANGKLRFVEHFAMKDALDLAAGGATLPVPLSVGDKSASLAWPLSFERPEDLIYSGPTPGANGPPVWVLVDRRNPKRIVFNARANGRNDYAIVEANDVGFFHVASRGARGESGSAGSDGASGSSGGTCQDGGNGEDGGSGGDGGPGGNGGNVEVHIACGSTPCPEAAAFYAQTIVSQGGAGGEGGPGGSGGSGGSGGPAGSDTTNADGSTTSGCSAGSDGSSGSSGASGANGPAGKPGKVSVVVDA